MRFEDFCRAFARVVDFTLESEADVFLFSGDAYKTAAPEPVYQEAFARQLKRLSEAGVPSFLLVGNHDQILKAGSTHAMSVFQSLEVPGLTVISRPEYHRVQSKSGIIQIIGLPHVTRHMLMASEKYADLTANEINKVMVERVAQVLSGLYEQIDPDYPSVLTAHIMLDTARAGAEQDLMVGYSMSYPIDLFIDQRLDYVALGHVHAHQVLREKDPLIAYAGSLERVDFSEEREDKGFLELDIERKKVAMRFHSIGPRPFITYELDLRKSAEPDEELFSFLSARAEELEGAVLRVKYKIQQSRLAELNEERLRSSLGHALSLRFKPELEYFERPRRLPGLSEKSALNPLEALNLYLSEYEPEKQKALLELAQKVIESSAECED